MLFVSSAPLEIRKVNVYIDSWNLYKGCLEGTPYRWIDVAEMARQHLPKHYTINRIRFFTAKVAARPHDIQAPVRQETLFRALRTLPNLQMHFGRFLVSQTHMPLVSPPPSGPRWAHVIKTEEKGSDVNIATHLLVDVFDDEFDAAMVVSDDSDLVEPITIVRRRFGKQVRVLSPRGRGTEMKRAATRWHQIDPAKLAASQFAPVRTDAHGTFSRPAGW